MPSLNLDLNYFDHRKTKRLVGLLGKGADILPLRLWCYTGKHHAEDGLLDGYSTQEIESMVGWWGEDGKMVNAMIKAGFLDQIEDGFQVHDWLDHEGHIISYRNKAKKAITARWAKERKKRQSDTPSIRGVLPQEYLGDTPSNTSAVQCTPPISPPQTGPPGKPEAKDIFWEPLIRIFGLTLTTPDDELTLYRQCIAFRDKGASPAEVESRAKLYRRQYPGMTFSVKALLRNWDALAFAEPDSPGEMREVAGHTGVRTPDGKDPFEEYWAQNRWWEERGGDEAATEALKAECARRGVRAVLLEGGNGG